ncbi:MAG: J domain-containing protein [Myxococcales bacterium]|nr:J domain-containing protein [Myxococcales bacterium]
MIEVLYFSDRSVKRKLFERVGTASGPLMVTAVRHGPHMRLPERRAPFLELERSFGEVVDQLLVADEGKVEGMWRDPMGDLADALFPKDRRRAYAAAGGYLFLERGVVRAVVPKHGLPHEDAYFLQLALSRLCPEVPEPDPSERPGRRKRWAEDAPRREAPPPKGVRQDGRDAWALLGIRRGASMPEAKRAFRALVAQYHPDKVAHLAAEFRELAERRTRQILEAWERVQSELEQP